MSATGVAESPFEAKARCQAEYSEAVSWQIAGVDSCFATPNPCDAASGFAAAYSPGIAARRAICEASERQAVHNWWYQGSPSSFPDPGLTEYFDQQLNAWQRETSRPANLLQLSSFAPLPVFLAWSSNQDGVEILLGAASRPDPKQAVQAALRELIQMEFGLEIIKYRLRGGVDLTDAEKAKLARSSSLKTANCVGLLSPTVGHRERQQPAFANAETEFCLSTANSWSRARALPRPDGLHHVAQAQITQKPYDEHRSFLNLSNSITPWRTMDPY